MTIGGGVPQHTHSGGAQGGTRLPSHVPSGAIMHFAHANDPGASVGDYLECNGQNVSRTVYASLFAAVGVTWGAGDGVSTFTLPDARRRSPVGKGGSGTGTLGNAVGNTGGEEAHALSIAEHASHDHGGGGTTSAPSTNPLWGNYAGAINISISAGSLHNPGDAHTHTYTIPAQGSGTAHNTYSPAYVCGVWIKS